MFRTKSNNDITSSISSFVLSVKVVSFCSLVLIISVVLSLSIGMLVKRDTTSWDVNILSSCRVIDFSLSARCLEFFTWCCVSLTIGPRISARLRDTL